MRSTRGLMFGLLTGLVVGFILFIRSQRLREELGLESYQPEPKVRLPQASPPRVKPTAPAAAPPARVAPRGKDRLEKIHGIGPVYAQRLNAAGVNTFAGLAALTPERVRAIIGGTRLPADPAAWIAEARKLSEG